MCVSVRMCDSGLQMIRTLFPRCKTALSLPLGASQKRKRGGRGEDKEGKLISPLDISDIENKARWLESQSSCLIWLHVQYECIAEAQTRELDEDYPHDCSNQMEWDARWPSVFAPDGAIAPQTLWGILHVRLTWNRAARRRNNNNNKETTNAVTGMSGEDVRIKQTCVIKLIPDARQLFVFFICLGRSVSLS